MKYIDYQYFRVLLILTILMVPFFVFSRIDNINFEQSEWKKLDLTEINKLAENTLFIDFSKALEMASYVTAEARASNNAHQETKALKILCEIYTKKGDFDQTIKYTERINQLANEYKNSKYIVACYNYCYGLLNLESNDFVLSGDYLFKALTLFENSQADIEQIKTLTLIGILFYKQRSYDKSMQFYQQSLELSRLAHFDLGIAASLNNIAAVKNTLHEYIEANKYFNEALYINKKFNNFKWIIINYLNLGVIAGKLGDYGQQNLNFEKCISLCDSLKNYEIKAQCYINYATSYIERGDIFMARNYMEKAKDLVNKENIVNSKLSLFELLTSYYLVNKDTSKAFIFNAEATIIRDSLFSHNNVQQLYLKEFAYNLKSKENQIKLQAERQKWILLVLISIISLIIALGYLFFYKSKVKLERSEQEKAKANDALLIKNKELTSKTLFISEKNKALTDVAQQLKDLANTMINDEDRRKVQYMSNALTRHNNEDEWEEFELYFTSVYPEFNEKIRSIHPDLSPAELKLCTFLKLNMSSKDISNITGQQITSLEVARSRLRKKLGITNSTTNLNTYINSI